MCTEFFGAVVLGSKVTGIIKNNIIELDRFRTTPSTLILAMGCAEFASAFWLLAARKVGYPVSTTQTIVGALVGVGIAAQAQVSWAWSDGSVSQIAASWGIAPCISAAFAAILFGSLKFTVLERENSFEKAMKVIPFYLAFTAAILALFITVEAPGAPLLEELGAGIVCGIILGVFFGILLLSYIFFVPYVHRRLVKEDTRIRLRHIFLGPLLYMENPLIYLPAKGNEVVIDYYVSAYDDSNVTNEGDIENNSDIPSPVPMSLEDVERGKKTQENPVVVQRYKRMPEPEERFLAPTAYLPIHNPRRIWSFIKYFFLQGVTRDCVTHASSQLAAIHGKAKKYDNRVEHLWTYAQVARFAMELGAAITVLLASRLGLPVSTTQCLTGAVIGVALMNFDVGAVNWRQVAFIFSGWIVTLPCAGLIGGLLMAMLLNTPQFGQG
ncbi:phosphate transporter [Colletotrichum filicis]|nr:phosphate transporter [Colletotrichum filicis]